ncbi:hypothetical protein Bca4012_089079 [Brassica carinata]
MKPTYYPSMHLEKHDDLLKEAHHTLSQELQKLRGSKGKKEARNHRSEIPQQQTNVTKRHKEKEDASSGDELQDSKRGRTKLERWACHKERDDSVTVKASSTSSKFQEKEKGTNGRVLKRVHDKNRDVTEKKSSHDPAETKDISEKGPPGDRHLDTVEKLKKRSERFKLPMPTEKDTTGGVKKMESETLPSAKIQGHVGSFLYLNGWHEILASYGAVVAVEDQVP